MAELCLSAQPVGMPTPSVGMRVASLMRLCLVVVALMGSISRYMLSDQALTSAQFAEHSGSSCAEVCCTTTATCKHCKHVEPAVTSSQTGHIFDHHHTTTIQPLVAFQCCSTLCVSGSALSQWRTHLTHVLHSYIQVCVCTPQGIILCQAALHQPPQTPIIMT